MDGSQLQRKFLRLVLAVVLLAQGLPVSVLALPDIGTSIENVHFEKSGELIKIFYDLNAPLDKLHDVRLYLRRESDMTFLHRPSHISGDAGTIVIPGVGRRIVWDITKEFPEGLPGDDYYFVVEAEYVEPEGTFPWIWVGGGAALVGGLVGILLLGGDDVIVPPDNTGFPDPPGRP
jgi:hypothetical protein